MTPRGQSSCARLRWRKTAFDFAAYIHPQTQDSGPYGGMSIAIFPAAEPGKPCLLTFVVGTAGLDPDESILGRPGHAHKIQAYVPG